MLICWKSYACLRNVSKDVCKDCGDRDRKDLPEVLDAFESGLRNLRDQSAIVAKVQDCTWQAKRIVALR